MKKNIVTILFVLTCFSLALEVKGQARIIFQNGGSYFNEIKYSDTQSFWESLSYGETLAFWWELDLGYFYGPTFSNEVQTVFSDSLESHVDYLATESDLLSEGITTETTRSGLEYSLFLKSLLSELENSGQTYQVSWEKLHSLYAATKLSQKLTQMELLTFLRMNGIIDEAEFNRIKQLLSQDNFLVNVVGYNFLQFLIKYNLTQEVDLSELQTIFNKASLVESLDKNVLEKSVDLEALKRDVRIGSPKLILTKQVVQPYIHSLNGTINYSLNIKNVGQNTATDVIVIDCLPKGLKYMGARIRGNLYTVKVKKINQKEVVIWKLKNNMPANDTCTIYFDTKIIIMEN